MQFLYLVIAGAFVAFLTAWGIGANDVANAFATSVGAKSLTLQQAVLAAAVFEFSGAFFLGQQTASTVKSKITDTSLFKTNPYVLSLGMFSALTSTAIWLYIASRYGLPVSTTHSIIGGIVGFALCAKGWNGVNHAVLGQVVLSWVASRVLSGIFGAILFASVRRFILRADDSLSRALKFYPIFIFLVAFVMSTFMMVKGLKRFNVNKKLNPGLEIGIALGVGAVLALVVYLMTKQRLEKWVETGGSAETANTEEETAFSNDKIGVEMANQGNIAPDREGGEGIASPDANSKDALTSKKWYNAVRLVAANMVNDNNIHGEKDERTVTLHENCEEFDEKTERVFNWLQVATACLDAFAHGANDVANSIAPFAAIVGVYETGKLSSKQSVPSWILAFGGIGIVIGLATYGYKVITSIGVKLAKITPSRGYSIELSAAVTVIIASWLGIPVSTTHCQVGSTVGVGMLEGRYDGVNWRLFANVFVSWVATLIITGLTSALFFSYAAFAPKCC